MFASRRTRGSLVMLSMLAAAACGGSDTSEATAASSSSSASATASNASSSASASGGNGGGGGATASSASSASSASTGGSGTGGDATSATATAATTTTTTTTGSGGGACAGTEPVEQGAPLTWESAEVTYSDASVIVEKVTYLSQGLKVVGQVCRPNGPGPYPIAVNNHGGFSGIQGEWVDSPAKALNSSCVKNAKNANKLVTLYPSYRGEDGSEGKIEVCLGEVDDVLRMLQIGLAQPWANPNRVIMSGVSHGGCITTRAVQRGAPVQLAINFAGPMDMTKTHAYLADAAANSPDPAVKATSAGLIAVIEKAAGGKPAQVPDAYVARSPASFGCALDAFAYPYMIIHGAADTVVPPLNPCALSAASTGFENYHVGTNGKEIAQAPAGCEPYALAWKTTPRPTASWTANRYLMVYEGLDHTSMPALPFNDYFAFVIDRAP